MITLSCAIYPYFIMSLKFTCNSCYISMGVDVIVSSSRGCSRTLGTCTDLGMGSSTQGWRGPSSQGHIIIIYSLCMHQAAAFFHGCGVVLGGCPTNNIMTPSRPSLCDVATGVGRGFRTRPSRAAAQDRDSGAAGEGDVSSVLGLDGDWTFDAGEGSTASGGDDEKVGSVAGQLPTETADGKDWGEWAREWRQDPAGKADRLAKAWEAEAEANRRNGRDGQGTQTQGEKSKGAEKNNRSKSGTDVADSAPSRGFGAKKISNVRGKRANANRNARPTKGVPKRLVIEEDVGSMVDGGNDAGHDEEEVVDWAMGQKLVESKERDFAAQWQAEADRLNSMNTSDRGKLEAKLRQALGKSGNNTNTNNTKKDKNVSKGNSWGGTSSASSRGEAPSMHKQKQQQQASIMAKNGEKGFSGGKVAAAGELSTAASEVVGVGANAVPVVGGETVAVAMGGGGRQGVTTGVEALLEVSSVDGGDGGDGVGSGVASSIREGAGGVNEQQTVVSTASSNSVSSMEHADDGEELRRLRRSFGVSTPRPPPSAPANAITTGTGDVASAGGSAGAATTAPPGENISGVAGRPKEEENSKIFSEENSKTSRNSGKIAENVRSQVTDEDEKEQEREHERLRAAFGMR